MICSKLNWLLVSFERTLNVHVSFRRFCRLCICLLHSIFLQMKRYRQFGNYIFYLDCRYSSSSSQTVGVMCRRAQSSQPMLWTCYASRVVHDQSRRRKLIGWSALYDASLQPSSCSWSRALVRRWWFCAHGSSMQGSLLCFW